MVNSAALTLPVEYSSRAERIRCKLAANAIRWQPRSVVLPLPECAQEHVGRADSHCHCSRGLVRLWLRHGTLLGAVRDLRTSGAAVPFVLERLSNTQEPSPCTPDLSRERQCHCTTALSHTPASILVTSAARTLQDAHSAVAERCSVAQGAHADRQPAH